MLIVAALNLPYTVNFQVDDSFIAEDVQMPIAQTGQSLVRPAEEDSEPKPEVPFDFDAIPSEGRNHPQLKTSQPAKPKQSKPSKSIVDERKISNECGRRPSLPNSSGTSTPTHNEQEHTCLIDRLQKSFKSKSLLKSLLKDNVEDEDSKIGYEIAGASESKLLPLFGGSSASLSSIGSTRRKRQNSSASHLSSDGHSINFYSAPFHLEVLKSSNRGLFNALDSTVEKDERLPYKSVGLTGLMSDSLPQETKDDIKYQLLNEKMCYAVFVSEPEREGHYDGYCKEFLWPTFHCQIPDVPSSKAYEEHSWGDYVRVNQAIADKVIEAYEPGDTIWVQDYHLMLVPRMVRDHLPHAPIGFFMHVAFPSSEVFRCLAYRSELLSGMLAANSIAFHIPEYAQHFKMSLARILAVDITGPGIIETADHDAFVTSFPLGIDVKQLDRILDVQNPDSAVQQHRSVIRKRWPFQRIIASRDKLDPIRGLSQKLRAFDRFLSENPHWATEVVLVQICTSGSTSTSDSYIESMVDQINSKYGDIASGVQPVVFLKQDVKFEQYLALLSEADGFCVSCLRDGMNLTCHEYIHCNDSERMGPLILSEFTGSASVLGNHSLIINPWDQDQLAQAFKTCVEMPKWERERRWLGLKESVRQHPASLWTKVLTQHIQEAWEDGMSRECSKPDMQQIQHIYHSVLPNEKRLFLLEVEQAATAEARKVLEEEKGEKVVRKYEQRKSNLHNKGLYYTTRLSVVIRDLCSDPRNVVYVISAESPDHMERIFRSLPGLGLIAEFGKFVRMRGEVEWVELASDEDSKWIESLKPWIKLLTERNLTSNIVVHESSIVVEFSVAMDAGGDQRDMSTIGEYISLINDHYARQLGIRTRLEGEVLTLYRSNLGITRKRAFELIVKAVPDAIGMTMIAIQPFATEADDVIYDWAELLKSSGRTRQLVTTVVGKHPSHAQCMVEGTNALLNMLHTMRTKEPVPRIRTIPRSSETRKPDDVQ